MTTRKPKLLSGNRRFLLFCLMGNRLSAQRSIHPHPSRPFPPHSPSSSTVPPSHPATLAIPHRKPTPLITRTMVRHGWHACYRVRDRRDPWGQSEKKRGLTVQIDIGTSHL